MVQLRFARAFVGGQRSRPLSIAREIGRRSSRARALVVGGQRRRPLCIAREIVRRHSRARGFVGGQRSRPLSIARKIVRRRLGLLGVFRCLSDISVSRMDGLQEMARPHSATMSRQRRPAKIVNV